MSVANSKTIDFAVERKGKTIGSHKTRISADGNKTVVDVSMRLKAGFLGIPVYRFSYKAKEKWSKDRLQTITVSVDDNGEKSRIEGKSAVGQFIWQHNGVSKKTKGTVFPSNHWNSTVLKQTKVLNTLTGNLARVRIKKVGTETLKCRRGTRKANRYRYSGDLDTEVWYDNENNWVGLRFKAEDGSIIFFRC